MADDLHEESDSRRNQNQEKEKGEEPQKSYETILEQEIAAGLTELERPAGALLLSGLSAGSTSRCWPASSPARERRGRTSANSSSGRRSATSSAG